MDANILYCVFAVVIGLCALLSPMLVAGANNKHQLELKKLELNSQQMKHANEIIDNYFRFAGAAIGESNTHNITQFGEYSNLVYFYIPNQYHGFITSINNSILQEYNRTDALGMLEEFAKEYSEKRI